MWYINVVLQLAFTVAWFTNEKGNHRDFRFTNYGFRKLKIFFISQPTDVSFYKIQIFTSQITNFYSPFRFVSFRKLQLSRKGASQPSVTYHVYS